MKKYQDELDACFENICKNFGVIANLHVSKPLYDRNEHDRLIAFVDVHSSSHISFYEGEILNNFSKTGIKSKKDYRRLRNLMRFKLIQAIRELHDLSHEGLRILGVKNKN